MKPASADNGVLVPAVDRAALILRAVASSPTALGVSELSRQLGLNKSTAHDILNTLCHHRLLERDDAQKTYRLGPALAELGRRAGDHADLHALARPRMVALARAAGATVLLGTFHAGYVTIIDTVEASDAVKITAPVGRHLHYSAGAFGKVFLAALPESEANQLTRSQPLRAYTPKSMTRPAAYRACLNEVRTLGYALDQEEYLEGVCAAAAPIVDVRGCIVAVLCTVGFSTRLPIEALLRVARQTREAAEAISRQLGAAEYPAWNGVQS